MNSIYRLGILRIQPHLQPAFRYTCKREMEKWIMPTFRAFKNLKDKHGWEKPSHRNTYLEWNYEAELYAFGKRLQEDFNDGYLRQALTETSYVSKIHEDQMKVGIEPSPDEYFDNREMIRIGEKLIEDFVLLYLRHVLPRFPEEGIQSLKSHLLSEETLSHVSRGIGTDDLILCADFPVLESTLAKVFKALVSALNDSSGLERASLFIRDFVITQLAEQNINDLWELEDPISALKTICKNEGVSEPEPRLVGEAGVNTLLALYRVGLYVDKQLIGLGPGETVDIAHEIAAIDALRRLFGTAEHQLVIPFDLVLDPNAQSIPNVSLSQWSEEKVNERLKLIPPQTKQASLTQ